MPSIRTQPNAAADDSPAPCQPVSYYVMSLFSSVELAPRDPILGLNEAFRADPRETKVNLSVGVYFDDQGRLPLLRAVQAAELARIQAAAPRGYLPIEGIADYDTAVQHLLFGAESALVTEDRVITTQAIGGTGALKIGADFLKRLLPNSAVAISNPSWENHRALFTSAGFDVVDYPYYDPSTHGADVEAMLACLRSLPEQTIVVLHACCHNPTGVDLTEDNWHQVVEVLKARNHVPFLDMAYQGFGDGIAEDATAVNIMSASGMNFFVSSSFSKSFSLYGERVGALSLVTSSKEEKVRVLSQLKRVIRTNYSNPPTHGATVVASVLKDASLRAMWEEELGEMRTRIKAMREEMIDRLQALGVNQDFSFVREQRGMFSYSGLTLEQVIRLRDEFGIYALDSGRICVAALNSGNIGYVTESIAKVLAG
ncbi:amino acid aminotransferase [Pokkaliibacter sp. CJK22405]|uniref:amino acid aminotransferase n=1 Tax=Pokkaliibacter sp. CJK22405 TaxID=3384615 RepID=UPI00398510EF